jgi:hypothetical protein
MTTSPTVFDVPDMTVAMEADGVEVRSAPAGDSMTLIWISCPKGFDFGPALKGLPHDMCPCEHWGIVTKGGMDVVTHDGESLTLSAGQPFHLLPGHSPAFPEDCSWYEFTPSDQAQHLFEHLGIA